MGLRRQAREYALQILFQQDSRQQRDLLSESFQSHRPFPKSVKDFSACLVQGVTEHLSEVDDLIRKYTDHWSLERMALVDRNILRIAIFELLYLDDIPAKVTLNEAIEVAKRYGDESSSAFVNGILDRILCEEERTLAKKVEVQKSLNAN